LNLFACSEFGRIYEIFDSGKYHLLLDSGYDNVYTCIHSYRDIIFVGSSSNNVVLLKKEDGEIRYHKVSFLFSSFMVNYITNIEDLIFLCSSNNDLILVLSFDDFMSKIGSGEETKCCALSFMLLSHGLGLNSIQQSKGSYLVSTRKYEKSYNNEQKEGGRLRFDYKFDLTGKEKYGWEVAGMAVDDNDDVFCVCNGIYKSKTMLTCLVCNNDPVMVFNEDYFLSSVSCNGKDIYVSGRVISNAGKTTENKGFILKTTKNEYKVDYMYYITNSGLITGCCCSDNKTSHDVDVSYLKDLCNKNAIVMVKEEGSEVIYGKLS